MLQGFGAWASNLGSGKRSAADSSEPITHYPTMPRVLFALFVLAAWPSLADAQIYSWVDANGTRVLSDRKLDAPSNVYEVSGAPAYRTTMAVASTGPLSMYDAIVDEHATQHSLRPEL